MASLLRPEQFNPNASLELRGFSAHRPGAVRQYQDPLGPQAPVTNREPFAAGLDLSTILFLLHPIHRSSPRNNEDPSFVARSPTAIWRCVDDTIPLHSRENLPPKSPA